MTADDSIDWTGLWRLAESRFVLGLGSIHGPHHWRKVERNALQLATETKADDTTIRLFAVLHDSCRQNESHDPQHGWRAAEWAATLRGRTFMLDDDRFAILVVALTNHDKGQTSADMTIGTCWDADRLELTRVGMKPDPTYMSTPPGRDLAARGWPFVR